MSNWHCWKLLCDEPYDVCQDRRVTKFRVIPLIGVKKQPGQSKGKTSRFSWDSCCRPTPSLFIGIFIFSSICFSTRGKWVSRNVFCMIQKSFSQIHWISNLKCHNLFLLWVLRVACWMHFQRTIQRLSHYITSFSFPLLVPDIQLAEFILDFSTASAPPTRCLLISQLEKTSSPPLMSFHLFFLNLLTSPLLLFPPLLANWWWCGKASVPLLLWSLGRDSWGRDPGMTWGRQWHHVCWEPRPWWRPACPNLENNLFSISPANLRLYH